MVRNQSIHTNVRGGHLLHRLRPLAWLMAFLLLVVLPGCLLNRVTTVKAQFCDFDTHFTVAMNGSMEFQIHDPVLLDSDLVWLSGAEPTSTSMGDDLFLMRYIIEKVMPVPDTSKDIEIELAFSRHDDEFRLSRVRFDEQLSALFGSESVDQERMKEVVQNVCDAGIAMASPRMELEITEAELAMLPSREEMIRDFGEPTEVIEPGRVFAYEYRLKASLPEQAANPAALARVVVWFDAAGENMIRMESRYSRYEARADFVNRKLQLKFHI